VFAWFLLCQLLKNIFRLLGLLYNIMRVLLADNAAVLQTFLVLIEVVMGHLVLLLDHDAGLFVFFQLPLENLICGVEQGPRFRAETGCTYYYGY